MITIPDNELTKQASYDNHGYLFHWNKMIYRAIYPHAEQAMRDLFRCGLIEELMTANLFPKTEITTLETSDCSMVLWHERIPAPSLPSEWSFSMLKDAAKLVLQINMIAQKYGYQTIDAHGFNVVFRRGKPLFVDIGSFVKVCNDFNCSRPGWRPYHEFMRSFYAPLKLWSAGEPFIARSALYGMQMPMVSYWRCRNFALRLLPIQILHRFETYYYKYKALNTIDKATFIQHTSNSRAKQRLAHLVEIMARYKMLWFSSVNVPRLLEKVERLKRPKIRTDWDQYHDNKTISQRFKTILQKLDDLQVTSVLDMAGNAGLFSRNVALLPSVEFVVCADYDDNAIDLLYHSLQTEQLNVCPVVLNFAAHISESKTSRITERLKCDAVVALALSHHLILTQGLTIGFVFERLKSFCQRYVLVEFMPMGKYSSQQNVTPVTPAWYTQQWFREHFQRHFTLLYEGDVDINRVLFIGSVEGANASKDIVRQPL